MIGWNNLYINDTDVWNMLNDTDVWNMCNYLEYNQDKHLNHLSWILNIFFLIIW